MAAAEQQRGEQEVDEHHGRDAARLAYERDADHEQEHVWQVVDLQEVQEGIAAAEQRSNELITNDVVVDLEQDAERGDDQDVLGGPALPALGAQRGPEDDADPADANDPNRYVEEEVGSRRQPDRAGKNHMGAGAHWSLQMARGGQARTTWAPWPHDHSRSAVSATARPHGFSSCEVHRRGSPPRFEL